MTNFEIIILVLIYCFCYGCACKSLEMDDESGWYTIFRIIVSIFIAFYVPIIIGMKIANKLNMKSL